MTILRSRRNAKLVAYSLVFLAAAGIGAVSALSGLGPPNVSIEWRREQGAAPVPEAAGPEVVFVYLGSSTCKWCQAEELPGLIAELKNSVRTQAEAEGFSFSTIGIAKDASITDGLEHLRRIGAFDEVSTGRGWLNLGILQYVFVTHPGRAATPQVIVLSRLVERKATGFSIIDENVLARKTGLGALQQWAESGALLLGLAPSR